MEKKIRNVAVIAHVDHGKTTLIDALLKQTHVFRFNSVEMSQERILDKNELERERGITILAKNCVIHYGDIKINIIDTPGHSDFSGEVERTLSMADGALLIIDAYEGPMPQTKFVLKKALALGLKVVVVVNKLDKPLARVDEVVRKTGDLFLELAKDENDLDFDVLYAIGKRGVVFESNPADISIDGDAKPLLDYIVNKIPAPVDADDKPAKMLVSSLEYDPHIGRIAIGKLASGKIKSAERLFVAGKNNDGYKVEHLMVGDGLGRSEVDEVRSGDIVMIAGFDDISIGETIAASADETPLPSAEIAEPSVHMSLASNTSPVAGKEGSMGTSRQLEERLNKELESNLSLRVEKMDGGQFKLSGRGELHLAILLESLRREGYEMEVGKPKAIVKKVDGVLQEPIEELTLVVEAEYTGVINQELGKRLASLIKMENLSEKEVEFVFRLPTRSILGLRSLLVNLTKGTVIFDSRVVGFEKMGKELPKLRSGVLISAKTGDALAHGLAVAQGRGTTFVSPGEAVYEGQIIGQNSRMEDIEINVCKGKKLTNMRSKSSDGIISLAPAVKLSLEQAIDFLEEDELLEITPKSLRLRKKYLTEIERRRQRRRE